MNRDQVQGCGCLVGLLAALAAIGGGGLLALAVFVSFVGWPIAAALGLVLAAGAATLIYFAMRYIVAARIRSRTTGPYRGKLAEIDRLAAEVEASVARVTGSEFGAGEIRSSIVELKRRRDSVLHALIEVDEYLRSPGTGDVRLRTESTYTKVRERLAGEAVKPEYAENAARLRDVQTAVGKVKAEREALIANLDRIAIGLREIRARMVPTASGAASRDEIAKDLTRLADAIGTEERIRRELDAIEGPDESSARPPRGPDKLPH